MLKINSSMLSALASMTMLAGSVTDASAQTCPYSQHQSESAVAISNGGEHVIHAMPVAFEQTATAAPDIVDTAVSAGQFNTLVTAVKAAGLLETLKGTGPFTVFAPTDEAFSKVPAETLQNLLKPENKQQLQELLTYHVVSGKVMAADVTGLKSAQTVQGSEVKISTDGGVMINDAKVIKADIECANGVIHVIDSVIMPSDNTQQTVTAAEPAATMPEKDIVDTAIAAGNFSTLVAAVKAAGLVETLKGEGPFTVFAPSDAAFGKLPVSAVEDLLKPENKEKLTSILTYHVVPGKVMAADAKSVNSAETVSGKSLSVSSDNGGVQIGDANVVAADIECKNGVIHVIDSVLMPE